MEIFNSTIYCMTSIERQNLISLLLDILYYFPHGYTLTTKFCIPFFLCVSFVFFIHFFTVKMQASISELAQKLVFQVVTVWDIS